MKSKTIILSQQENKGRGILTLFEEDDLLKCRLRLYNVEKLSRYCKIGIYHNNEVYSANLLEKNGVYESSLVGDFDIEQDFYTAIINTAKDNEVILSGGTYAGFFFNDNSVFERENKRFSNLEKENPNTNLYSYEEENYEIKCEENCDKCATCKYKEYFYNHNAEQENYEILQQAQNDKNNYSPHQNISDFCDIERNEVQSKYLNTSATLSETNKKNQQTQNSEIEQPKEEENKHTIIQSILPQFKYVFENYQQDEILNNLIPNSKFVKIQEEEKQYSIGAIYSENEMKYICYAVMCNYNTPAPTELGEHYQWLPLDKEDPLSEGYYIVFQDANDLKILEL